MPKISNEHLDLLSTACNNFFNSTQIDYLYHDEESYQPTYISRVTLTKYFDNIKVTNILNGNTYFLDLNKGENNGRFELQFADKLLILSKQNSLTKKTSFTYPEKFSVGPYQLNFMTDEEYRDGVIFYIGEFTEDCESIGKPGGNYAFFDAFSENSRTFLIRRNGKIVGQSCVFLNDQKNTIVISSVACTPDINTETIRPMVEYLANALLTLNPEVNHITIGIGGRNFVSMNGNAFRRRDNVKTPEFIALGKIRHAEKISELETEVKVCEQSIGYPILRDSNHTIRIQDEEKYRMEPQNRKDCYRVAVVVSRNNLVEKTQKVNQELGLIRQDYSQKSDQKEVIKHNHSKKRLSNIAIVMQQLAVITKKTLKDTKFEIEQVPTKTTHVGFFIALSNAEKQDELKNNIQNLSNYRISAGYNHSIFKALLDERQNTNIENDVKYRNQRREPLQNGIYFSAGLKFFSNGRKGNTELWGELCRRVQNEMGVPSSELHNNGCKK